MDGELVTPGNRVKFAMIVVSKGTQNYLGNHYTMGHYMGRSDELHLNFRPCSLFFPGLKITIPIN